jgi:hypothetical protein
LMSVGYNAAAAIAFQCPSAILVALENSYTDRGDRAHPIGLHECDRVSLTHHVLHSPG